MPPAALLPRTTRLPETTRRGFLRAAAAVAATPAVGRFAAAEPAKPAKPAGAPGFVDAHAHIWTTDVARYPFAPNLKVEEKVPAPFTPEKLLGHAKPQGVDRVVLIQMIYYGTNNRYMLDSIAARPAVFRGVAVIDERQKAACDEMRSLAKEGVRGFRLYTTKAAAESWADSAEMRAMWTCAADEGLAMCLLADPDALPAVRAMCEQFPKTRVVIDHFARIGMKGPARPEDVDALCRLADFGETFVKTSAFYALGEKKAPYTDLAPLVRRLRDAYGAGRLMWASDCPFQVEDGHKYVDSIGLIRDRLDFLTDDDRTQMLRTTAERVFFA